MGWVIKTPASARSQGQVVAVAVKTRPPTKNLRGPTFASWCQRHRLEGQGGRPRDIRVLVRGWLASNREVLMQRCPRTLASPGRGCQDAVDSKQFTSSRRDGPVVGRVRVG